MGEQKTPAADEKLVPIKEQVYKDPRPIEQLQKYYDWPMTHKPGPIYDVVRLLLSTLVWVPYRARSVNSRRVPTSGSVIFAPNHFSNIDHFFVGAFTRRKLQFMAQTQLYHGWMSWVYKTGGVFPVRRGVRDEQSFQVVDSILSRGGCICMYCEGGRSRTGKMAEKPKPGIGRVALQSGAVVVPVAIYGSQKVRNWKKLQAPKVRVSFGEPLRYEVVADPTREQQQAAADEIFAEIRALYAELEASASE